MKLVDANVLLYAVNEDATHHEVSRRWLDDALSGSDTVAFAWVALLAFVRLTTKEGLFPHPLSVEAALDRVDAWLGAPPAVVVDPTPDHAGILRRLLAGTGTGGNLTNDAHLAALAVAHRCTVVSFDDDFGRFEGVRWERPTIPPPSPRQLGGWAGRVWIADDFDDPLPPEVLAAFETDP